MTDTLWAGHADLGRLRYAEACLKQGMSYQAAARASDVCELDLRDFSPGYGSAHREAPAVTERNSLGKCAAILPGATPTELGQIAALALRLLCEASGMQVVQSVCVNALKAMPARSSACTPRERLLAVVDAVAASHGITRKDVLGPNQAGRYAHPRQEAYWIVRQETGLSYASLARLFGRDHTTIIHGIRAHEARMVQQ